MSPTALLERPTRASTAITETPEQMERAKDKGCRSPGVTVKPLLG